MKHGANGVKRTPLQRMLQALAQDEVAYATSSEVRQLREELERLRRDVALLYKERALAEAKRVIAEAKAQKAEKVEKAREARGPQPLSIEERTRIRKHWQPGDPVPEGFERVCSPGAVRADGSVQPPYQYLRYLSPQLLTSRKMLGKYGIRGAEALKARRAAQQAKAAEEERQWNERMERMRRDAAAMSERPYKMYPHR